jgi:small subunit ribosomal protein S17
MVEENPEGAGPDPATPGAAAEPAEAVVSETDPDAGRAEAATDTAEAAATDTAEAASSDTPAASSDTPAASSDTPAAPRSTATETAAETTPRRPEQAAPSGDGPEASRPNRRKIREGLVLSIAMDQTAVVGVIERVRHPRYAKTVQRTKRLYAHDPNNDLRVGDRVRLAETRPLSKLKRWRVVDVLERAK